MSTVALICGLMLGAAGVLTTLHLIKHRELADRAIGIDLLVAVVLNALAVGIASQRDGLVAPLVLINGLMAYLGSVTVARYLEERRQ